MASTFAHIHLELGREPGHPFGDREHAYQLYLPLTGEGRIDAELWHKNAAICHVRRFRQNEQELRGAIRRGPGGRWVFDYDLKSDADDETGFRLTDERFVQGEYVSIHENDGKMHTFQIISVRPD